MTNAFDPEEHADQAAADGLLAQAATRSSTRAGWPSPGRTPHRCSRRSPSLELADRLDVVLAGPLTEDERELVAGAERDGVVRWVGSLDRERTLALQRAADTLLVRHRGQRGPSVATGKLFEYLAARRPILVLGEGTAAAEIVRERAQGRRPRRPIPMRSPAALERLVTTRRRPPDPAAIEPYCFPGGRGALGGTRGGGRLHQRAQPGLDVVGPPDPVSLSAPAPLSSVRWCSTTPSTATT